MKRYLERAIRADLNRKIVILMGPRQSGKTTLAKALRSQFDYLNFDNREHRIALRDRSWDRKKNLVIFDEIHKMKRWKQWLKGIFDTEGIPPEMIVTGSAKLDTMRKVGDSLAGRFFSFRLHPIDLQEVATFLPKKDIEEAFQTMLKIGGFPEPFLKGSTTFYRRWQRSHLDIILKQDLIELENVSEILSIEHLLELLRSRVGSSIAYNNLAEDLSCSDKTVKKWLTMLENMYVIFRISPYHKNLTRSLKKAPKYFFYDNGQVRGDEGAKFENLVACALLKRIQFLEDTLGRTWKLHYLRNKEKQEVDFLITEDNQPKMMIEVKWKDDHLHPHFRVFEKDLGPLPKIQLVGEMKREKTFPDGTEIRKAAQWLSKISKKIQ